MSAGTPALAPVVQALSEAGVRVLVLRGEERPAGTERGYQSVQILIPRRRLDAARPVLEALPWRYSWARSGLARLVPGASYWWDDGPILEAYWGCPAAPMPPAALRTLTDALWQGAREAPGGFLAPEPGALLVHLAVQSCRPGRGHEDDWRQFLELRPSIDDWPRVHTIARAVGVSRGVRRALDAAEAGSGRPGPGPIFDGALGLGWRLASAIQAYARPRRLKRLLAGRPSYGDATIRCRVARVEVHAGRGVFVPAPEAELFVEVASKRIEAIANPALVEVGTGCGVIALALANGRQDADVHATELAPAAVRWARHNARRLSLDRVRFYGGSLIDRLPVSLEGRVDVIIANLPYLPMHESLEIGSVPSGTIEGSGDDGLGLHRQLARDAIRFLKPGGGLLLQMLWWQWETLSAELAELGYRPRTPRFSGSFAICPADRP